MSRFQIAPVVKFQDIRVDLRRIALLPHFHLRPYQMSPALPVPVVPAEPVLCLVRIYPQAVEEGRGAVAKPPAAGLLVGAVHPLAAVVIVVKGREGLAVVVAQ